MLDNNATKDSELGQVWFRLKKNFPKRNKIQNSGRQPVNQENYSVNCLGPLSEM